MNLLEMLLSSMTTQSSTASVAKKTGLDSRMITYLVSAALPILIKKMTQNASTEQGAQSLLGALTQHTSQKSIADQIGSADETDGGKIISHILGSDEQNVVKGLAGQTGLSAKQVSSVLAAVAPAMLSGLSAATAKKKEKADLTSLLSMFAGQQAKPQTSGLENLLGSLLGAATSSSTANTIPLGQPAHVTNQAPAGMSALLGNLLGGATSAQAVQQDTATNGAQLLNVLSALMK